MFHIESMEWVRRITISQNFSDSFFKHPQAERNIKTNKVSIKNG